MANVTAVIQPPTEPVSRPVSIGELEMILLRAEWQPWVIAIVLSVPVPREVMCGGVMYIVKR